MNESVIGLEWHEDDRMFIFVWTFTLNGLSEDHSFWATDSKTGRLLILSINRENSQSFSLFPVLVSPRVPHWHIHILPPFCFQSFSLFLSQWRRKSYNLNIKLIITVHLSFPSVGGMRVWKNDSDVRRVWMHMEWRPVQPMNRRRPNYWPTLQHGPSLRGRSLSPLALQPKTTKIDRLRDWKHINLELQGGSEWPTVCLWWSRSLIMAANYTNNSHCEGLDS